MVRMLSAALVLWLFLRGTALADVLYTIEELSPLPGSTVTRAHAINDSGQIVGYSYTRSPENVAQGSFVTPMLWENGTATALWNVTWDGINAVDINNSGQIVGMAVGGALIGYPPDESGFICCGSGWGNWATLTPDSLAAMPRTDQQCAQDVWLSGISDAGYMLGDWNNVIYSPNIDSFLCEVQVFEFYESGLTRTEHGYVYDPFVDYFYDQGTPIAVNERRWVVVPSCTGDITGYAMRSFQTVAGGGSSIPLALEVSDQVAQSICDLRFGEIHNKLMNASGQFIFNFDGKAFLVSPVSEPATLALLGIGLAGLAFGRRKSQEGRKDGQ